MKGFSPEFLVQHRERLGTHKYSWTGRSPDTCAFTVGGETWCALPEADPIHQQKEDE